MLKWQLNCCVINWPAGGAGLKPRNDPNHTLGEHKCPNLTASHSVFVDTFMATSMWTLAFTLSNTRIVSPDIGLNGLKLRGGVQRFYVIYDFRDECHWISEGSVKAALLLAAYLPFHHQGVSSVSCRRWAAGIGSCSCCRLEDYSVFLTCFRHTDT